MENKNIVINKIDIRPVARRTTDIKTWRDALTAADKGKRNALYDLYEDLLLDNILDDAIDKRITAITNAEITFTRADGAPEPIMDTLMDTPEFEMIITEIMQAKFWGITLLEFEFFSDKTFKAYSIPRKHIRPKTGEIALGEKDETGIPYRDNDMFLEVDNGNLGKILKAAPYVIYKRNNFGDWSQYVEIFGMPIRTAYYEAYDEGMRIELLRSMEDAGGALNQALPKGSDFKTEAGATSGDGSIYDRLKSACNEEILIGILGQTMTTLDGSSRSQGEVHMQVQEDKHKADRRYVQRILNKKLLPLLEKRGYPVKDGYFYFTEQGESLSLEKRIMIDMQLASVIPMTAKHFYDTYGIAMPEEGEELITLPEPQAMPFDQPTTLADRVRRFFVEALSAGAKHGTTLTLADGDTLGQRTIKRVANGDAVHFDTELFEWQSAELLRALHTGYSGVKELADDFVYGWQDPAVLTAMENNLFRFSAGKTIAQVQQLNEYYRKSKSFEEFAGRAEPLVAKFNSVYAKTEYITAGAIAESSATYHRLMAQKEIFPHWEYKTAGDDKVRAEHSALNGLILPINDAAWRKIYPPNGWRCRCYVVPRMRHEVESVDFNTQRARVDAYYKSSDFKASEKSGFATNRALQNVVFTENQQYANMLKTNKVLDRMGIDDWGCKPMAELMQESTAKLTEYAGTAEQWRSANAVVSNHVIPDKVFKIHTSGKYAIGDNNRVRLLESMKETLAKPDEVWLNAEKNKEMPNNRTYLKYYEGETIVVIAKVVKGELEVHSWFSLNPKAENDYRRGMLIKKATRE